MKILVTGGSGFLGSHIIDRLIKDNHEITVLDIWKSSEIAAHNENSHLQFIQGSIMDHKLLSSLMENKDCVIHLAGILGTSESITMYDIEEVFNVNMIGTIRVLKMAQKFGVPRTIIPTTPNTPEKINPYKITKQAIEKICNLYSNNFNIEAVCLRLGNAFGSRERWLDSPFDAPYNYQKIIPTFIIAALSGKPVSIYGDGEQKSEYTYIDDVVEAFSRTISSDKNLGGEIIEVGRNKNHSVNEIVNALEETLGKKIEKNYLKMRPGEVKLDFSLSPTKLRELLDYEIKWELEDGLKETIPYYEKIFQKTSQ